MCSSGDASSLQTAQSSLSSWSMSCLSWFLWKLLKSVWFVQWCVVVTKVWHFCSLQRNCLGIGVRNHCRTVTRPYFSNCSRSSKLGKGKKNTLPSFGMNYCTAGAISWCEMKLELRSCWLWSRGSDLEGLLSLGALVSCSPSQVGEQPVLQPCSFNSSFPLTRVTLSSTECYIVHEIYNGENAQDQFEYELEQALEAQYKYIVIEPTRIGDETARWITVGNCLHKTAVLAGTTCLFTPLALPVDYSHYISLPAGVLSVACCTLYGISWQFDPCCKYQVEYDAYKLSRLPLHTLTSSSPVVLVRKDDLHRKRLHNTIALAALVYCVKKIYELYAVWLQQGREKPTKTSVLRLPQ